MDQKHAIEELIYKSCLLLDDKDFAGYLGLCDDSFHYRITTYSPEIRKEMTWLEHDKKGMTLLLNNLPKHNSDHSPLTRHAIVYTIDYGDGAGQPKVVSALQVFKTALDGGATELFAVGKLIDRVKVNGGEPKLTERTVRLDTRMLGIGYHVPL